MIKYKSFLLIPISSLIYLYYTYQIVLNTGYLPAYQICPYILSYTVKCIQLPAWSSTLLQLLVTAFLACDSLSPNNSPLTSVREHNVVKCLDISHPYFPLDSINCTVLVKKIIPTLVRHAKLW